jgi:hypothetical protein
MLGWLAGSGFALAWLADLQAAPTLTLLTAPTAGQRLELRVDGIPPSPNPFDPDAARLDAIWLLPSGQTIEVPAFW